METFYGDFFSRSFRIFSMAILLVATNGWAQTQANFPTSDLETGHTDSTSTSYALPGASGRHLATNPSGAVGLFHTYSALKQPFGPYSFGLYLAANYYVAKSFPAHTPRYITERFDSNLGLSYTPIQMLELFFNIGFLKTNDEAPINPLYKQIGNIGFGGKVTYPFTSQLTAGGVYYIEKRSAVSEITGSQYALNHELLGVVTYEAKNDFRYNANLGIRIDNNQRIVDGKTTDQRQLTIFHAYGTQVVPFALSAEYLMNWAAVSAEYSLDYVTTSSTGFTGQPQRITLGGKVFPSKDDALSLQLGLDLGLSKTDVKTVVKEPPVSFWLGLTYLFGQKQSGGTQNSQVASFHEDDFAKQVKKEKKVSIPDRKENRITGYITNIETGDPINKAKLYLCNDSNNPIVTDSSGQYRSKPMQTGSCEIRIEHPDYKTTTETVQVTGDANQAFDFGLLQESKEKGALLIRVKDNEGNPTESTITFPENPDLQSVQTNEFGQAKIPLPPGTYTVRAKSTNMKTQTNKVELSAKQNLFVDFALQASVAEKKSTALGLSAMNLSTNSVAKPSIKISKDKKTIEVPQKIQFEINKSLITDNSKKDLDSLAKFLTKHPEIKKIQIGGHTDNSGDAAKNMKLSQDRADAVKMYLIKKGINKKVLDSKGFGQTKPIADNKTDQGKNLNRRVEFKIINPTTLPISTKNKISKGK